MEDHVDNLNDLIADLREQLQVATQASPKAGGAARESLIIDLDAEPALPAVSVDDDDDNPVSPEAKKWGKIQRMMSSNISNQRFFQPSLVAAMCDPELFDIGV